MKQSQVKNLVDLKEYEVQEFNKAFFKGTKQAWKTYRRNVKKACEYCLISLEEQKVAIYDNCAVTRLFEKVCSWY